MDSLIITAIAAMLLMSVGIIFFIILYQRRVIHHQLELKRIATEKELELIQASIQSEENERMRIASELHDDVGATLASARLFLYKEKDNPYEEQIINQSKELLDESISKIRNISHKLQPAMLQHLGLEMALHSFVETISRSGKITVKFVSHNMLPRTHDNVELAIYRISQELITNILKHANASHIILETDVYNQQLLITYTHNGQGLTQEAYEELIYKKGATGLKNILFRIKSVNAVIQYYKADELFFKTELTVPLQHS